MIMDLKKKVKTMIKIQERQEEDLTWFVSLKWSACCNLGLNLQTTKNLDEEKVSNSCSSAEATGR